MRLSLIISFPLLLSALLAAADWDRLRPETEAPAIIAPEAAAVCRTQARALDAQRQWARDPAGTCSGAQ